MSSGRKLIVIRGFSEVEIHMTCRCSKRENRLRWTWSVVFTLIHSYEPHYPSQSAVHATCFLFEILRWASAAALGVLNIRL